MNQVLVDVASRVGALADLYAHFLTGRPDWSVHTIEPSLIGASEVRRCFWSAISAAVPKNPGRVTRGVDGNHSG